MTALIDLDDAEEARAERLHRESLVVDGLITRSYFRDEDYLSHLAEGGLTAANFTVASRTDFAGAAEGIQRCRRTVDAHADEFTIVETAADVRAAKESDRIGLIMGFQDSMPLEPRERMQLEGPGPYVDSIEQMGVRIVQLTYNYQNRSGAGCCERRDPGLSYFGQDLIASLNDAGVILDLSHCGDRTTTEAIEYSEDPVMVSHAGLRSQSNVGRNKTDEHVRAVGENGGVFCITFFPPCVKSDPDTHEVQPATVHDVLDQIDTAVELAGIDHVGFGTDMNDYWLSQETTAAHGAYRNFRPDHPEVYGRGPIERYEPYPEGVHRHTKLGNLTRGLVSRGYADEDIGKILGGNVVRLLEEVCDG